MDEREIELLKRALDLYDYTLAQRKDTVEENEFFSVREKLSEIIGVDVS